jgi:hypothetical protein
MHDDESENAVITANTSAYDEEVIVIGAVDSRGQSDTEERIRALIAVMPGQRRVLTGIIDYCREPRTPAEVDEHTAGLQQANVSIYTPVLLRQHLQKAGAIVYLQASGQSGNSGEEADGRIGADGMASAASSEEPVEYLVVGKQDTGCWLSSAAALNIIDSINPALEIAAVLDDEPQYREIYLHILGFCADAPRSKEQINALVDNDPLLQNPRRYSGYFIDRLDTCGALEWRPSWVATSAGIAYLSSLAECQSSHDGPPASAEQNG